MSEISISQTDTKTSDPTTNGGAQEAIGYLDARRGLPSTPLPDPELHAAYMIGYEGGLEE